MAIKREGWYYGKASKDEARRMQEKQAIATQRKLRRKLERSRGEEESGYRNFILACMADVADVRERIAA